MPKLGRKTPCPGCPWLRISRRGYLGEDEPESFYRGAITNESPWPCHEQINYKDPEWAATQLPDADLCAGQLIFFRNHLKMPRGPEMADAVRQVKPSRHVFKHPEEFVRHHAPDADDETVKQMAEDATWPCPQERKGGTDVDG